MSVYLFFHKLNFDCVCFTLELEENDKWHERKKVDNFRGGGPYSYIRVLHN